MSPTARTLDRLRRHGIPAQVVERRVPHTRNVTIDLFGCIDVIALPGEILGIQVTTGSHHAARLKKAREEKRLVMWLICGAKFEVWSWSERRGKHILRMAVARLKHNGANETLTIEFTEREEEEET
jgi:hypothetical protein